MAPETTTTTLITEVMKEVYEPSVTNTLVQDSDLLDLFEQEEEGIELDQTTGGKHIKTAHLFKRGTGYGARGESGYIPEPQAPKYDNATIQLKRNYGVLEISGWVFDRVRGGVEAFVNEADRQIRDMEESVRNDLDRQLHGLGGSIIARVNDASPDATLGIDSSFGIAVATRTAVLFQENEQIVFSANANGTPLRSAGSAQSAIIDNIDIDNNIITLDALPTGVADDDFIFSGDEADTASPAGGANKELMGLFGHIDDGSQLATYFGLSRSTYRLLKSFVLDASVAPHNGNLTEMALTKADDETVIRGGGKVDTILASRDALRSYWDSLKSDRRINDPRSFTGGKGDLAIVFMDRELRLRATRKMPPEFAFGCDTSGLKRYHNVGWRWQDRTGSMWKEVTDSVGRKDAFYAWGYIEMETVNLTPAKCFQIKGLSPQP